MHVISWIKPGKVTYSIIQKNIFQHAGQLQFRFRIPSDNRKKMHIPLIHNGKFGFFIEYMGINQTRLCSLLDRVTKLIRAGPSRMKKMTLPI